MDAIIPSHENGDIEFVQSLPSLPADWLSSLILTRRYFIRLGPSMRYFRRFAMVLGGNNYGQLGISSTIDYSTTQLVDLGVGRAAVSVSSGNQFTCAILDDGKLMCWGWNNFGKLGLGTTGNSWFPQEVNLGQAELQSQ